MEGESSSPVGISVFSADFFTKNFQMVAMHHDQQEPRRRFHFEGRSEDWMASRARIKLKGWQGSASADDPGNNRKSRRRPYC
jgi:hypothetical protein